MKRMHKHLLSVLLLHIGGCGSSTDGQPPIEVVANPSFIDKGLTQPPAIPDNCESAVNLDPPMKTVEPSDYIELLEDTCWVGDTLKLKNGTTIVTNGNELTIFFDSLRINGVAEIVSFNFSSSESKPSKPIPGENGTPSYPRSDDGNSASTSARRGSDGGHGGEGTSGKNGLPGKHAKPVSIFVSREASGELRVSNTGQQGGVAGDGGVGGKGGNGQQGKRSVTKKHSFLGKKICECKSGPGGGGRGGNGGAGGDAGLGGKGGDGGEVLILTRGKVEEFHVYVDVRGGYGGEDGLPGEAQSDFGFGGYGGRGSCGCRGAINRRKGPDGNVGTPGQSAIELRGGPSLSGNPGKHNLEGQSYFDGEYARGNVRSVESFCDVPDHFDRDVVTGGDMATFELRQTTRLWQTIGSLLPNSDIDVTTRENDQGIESVFINSPDQLFGAKMTAHVFKMIPGYLESGLQDKVNDCRGQSGTSLYACCVGQGTLATPNIGCYTRSLDHVREETGLGRAAVAVLGLSLVAKELAQNTVKITDEEMQSRNFEAPQSFINWGNEYYTIADAVNFHALATLLQILDDKHRESTGLLCQNGALTRTSVNFDTLRSVKSAAVLTLPKESTLITDETDRKWLNGYVQLAVTPSYSYLGFDFADESPQQFPDTNNVCHVFDRLLEFAPTDVLGCFISDRLEDSSDVRNLRSLMATPETATLLLVLMYLHGTGVAP